ncbi:MAG: acyl-CoA thioesterase [Planctomycetes bacterium]|nr:acyl-CoA thioesterase [Planctomycetota bacterium]
MAGIHEYSHTVCDDEIDILSRANNVAYIGWMQAAAESHTTALGWPLDAYRRLGSGWVVRAHAIEYRKPAQRGDRIVVQTWVSAMGKASSVRRYRILRPADGTLLATAETKWAYIDFATGSPARIPDAVLAAFPVVDR